MTDEITDTPAEPLFKANKRRKVIRRRNQDEDQVSDGPAAPAQGQESVDDGEDEVSRVVRRPAAKKHGMGFSSSGPVKTSSGDPSETALVPLQPGRAEEVVQSDRFVKPTGKVVIEDKHLTAYVDSKLAELRSSTATPNQDTQASATPSNDVDLDEETAAGLDLSSGKPFSQTNEAHRRRYPYGSSPRQPKRRRQPIPRGEDALARDAMVDQIMRESDIPIYDRTSAPNQQEETGEDFDADEAAAQAFKAEFLANLESRKRRKPPAPPVKPGQQPAAPSGPKLGGSRSQREKMKALEEAKSVGGKK